MSNKFSLVFMFLVSSIFYANAGLPEPYGSIQVLKFDPHGFCGKSNKEFLQKFAQSDLEVFIKTGKFIPSTKSKLVVELGVWLGTSAIYTASYLPKDSLLYAVDHWQGSLEHQHNRPDVQGKLPILYQQFLSNVIHKKMTHVIVPLKMTTLQAAEVIDFNPDIIYIDASHEEEDVYTDIITWFPKLAKNGIMCGDDWEWGPNRNPPFPVKRAVKRAAQDLNLEIRSKENFWYFIPKKSD